MPKMNSSVRCAYMDRNCLEERCTAWIEEGGVCARVEKETSFASVATLLEGLLDAASRNPQVVAMLGNVAEDEEEDEDDNG